MIIAMTIQMWGECVVLDGMDHVGNGEWKLHYPHSQAHCVTPWHVIVAQPL